MALLQTIDLTGASGIRYRFSVYSLDTEFNPGGAVYAFAKRVVQLGGLSNYTIIYVGQTNNLPERFDNHHKAACINRNGANCVAINPEPDEQRRLAIEQDLIKAYRPPCNG